jgi:hypothetical protein
MSMFNQEFAENLRKTYIEDKRRQKVKDEQTVLNDKMAARVSTKEKSVVERKAPTKKRATKNRREKKNVRPAKARNEKKATKVEEGGRQWDKKALPTGKKGKALEPKNEFHKIAAVASSKAYAEAIEHLKSGGKIMIVTTPIITDGRFTSALKHATHEKYHFYGNLRDTSADKFDHFKERLGMSNVGTGFFSKPEIRDELESIGFKFLIAKMTAGYINSKTMMQMGKKTVPNYGLRDGAFRDSKVRYELLEGRDSFIGNIHPKCDAFNDLFEEYGAGIDERPQQKEETPEDEEIVETEVGSDDPVSVEETEPVSEGGGDDDEVI